jgi:endonuclease-8
VPEGDSIFRAARTLDRALAGRTVTRFESVFPRLTRIDRDRPLRGRILLRVAPRGKHILMWFSGDLVLHTHMRMKGSWHLYRPGERWFRPRHDMRLVIATDAWEAVAFNVPVAEFMTAGQVQRAAALRDLGPDLLAGDFDAAEAARRIKALEGDEIADALLDQRAVAGIGNVYKSEVLFACSVSPFTLVRNLPDERIARIVSAARALLQANVAEPGAGIRAYAGLRRTTGRFERGGRLWVYGRGGRPCRRCGTAIVRRAQGPNARSTYWCPKCQQES